MEFFTCSIMLALKKLWFFKLGMLNLYQSNNDVFLYNQVLHYKNFTMILCSIPIVFHIEIKLALEFSYLKE
jgi:hypothetical protein